MAWFGLIAILIGEYGAYARDYRPLQATDRNVMLVKVCDFIKEVVPEGRTLLIYGYDWDPTIPYLIGRKAIMDRRDLPLDDPRIRESLANIGDQLGGMLVVGDRPPAFFRERIKKLRLQSKAFELPNALLFLVDDRSVP